MLSLTKTRFECVNWCNNNLVAGHNTEVLLRPHGLVGKVQSPYFQKLADTDTYTDTDTDTDTDVRHV